MQQVLYKLPDGWSWRKLSELAKTTSGGTPSRSNKDYWGGSIPWVKSGELGDSRVEKNEEFITELGLKNSSAKLFPKESLLLALYGATAGKLGVLTYDAATNQAVCCINQDDQLLARDFLRYYLLSQRKKIIEDSFGGAQPNISQAYVREIDIPTPPLTEQKRIVEKLDALLTRIDTAIEHLQESVTLADALSQNGLDVYFSELKKDYPELPLSKLADFISGYAFKSGDFISESGVKPIKITNVGVNEFSENAEEFLPTSYENEFKRFSVKANDIAIALTRPIINGGLKVCRVPESYSGALVNQRVAAITSDKKKLLDFIYLYLQSSRTKNYVLEKSKSLNQPNLSITDLKNLTLPLPANDEAIAKAVADCNALISKARKSKAEVSEKISMMQQLKASILDSAFKGEL